MAFSWVQDNSTQDSDTVTLDGVAAGNLIVIWIKWEDAVGNISVSDGTSSFQVVTGVSSDAGPCGQFAYLLSANGGNITYTVTFPGGAAYMRIIAFEFDYGTDTCSFDQSNVGSGSSEYPVSGNITTTGDVGLALGGFSEYTDVTITDRKINENAADGNQDQGDTSAWWEILSSTFANGHAQCDILGSSSQWVCNIIAFKAVTGGSYVGSPSGVLSKSGAYSRQIGVNRNYGGEL